MITEQTTALSLKDAYRFGKEKGLEEEVNKIQNMEIEDWNKSYDSTVRRGYIVDLFEDKRVFSQFKEQYWNWGNTTAGETLRLRYLKVKAQYENFRDGIIEPGESNDDDGTGLGGMQQFSLERQLQDFLRENWDRTDLAKEWEVYSQPENPFLGFEYNTVDVGRIDILAKHKTAKKWLVIELKRGLSSDRVVGQILRYTGWVRHHLAKENEQVEGLVIAHEVESSIQYAISDLPNIQLQTYEIKFVLNDVSKLKTTASALAGSCKA